MPVHNDKLTYLGNHLASLTGEILIASLIGTMNKTTPIEEILPYEPDQTTDGYQPIPYGATTGAIGSSGKYDLETVDGAFIEDAAGAGYQYKYVVLLYQAPTTRNKPITSINPAADVFTVAAHGLVSGDRVVISSVGALAGGIPQQDTNPLASTKLWAEVTDSNNFKLHTNSGLTALVDVTDIGSGSHRLNYANGLVWGYDSNPVTTVAPGQSAPVIVRSRVTPVG